MTIVITRYFESADQADAVKDELLYRKRFPRRIMNVYTKAESLAGYVRSGWIAEDTANAYAERLAQGGAVMVVEAGYRPLGVAKITRQVTAAMGAADMGGLGEEMRVKDSAATKLSVSNSHPLMLSRQIDGSRKHSYMADWPLPLISRRKPFRGSLIGRNAYMADKPIQLLSDRKPYTETIYLNKHPRMADWPIGLLVPRTKKYYGRFPFGHLIPGHRYQARFPFAHIVPGHKFMAKFPFGHLVPGHARMARWPFPLLINGKQGENALLPGKGYQARFPVDHLVPGNAYMAKFPFGHIVPGHRYQAKFPFGHIVPGHRYMARFPFGHIVPGHKFMAKFPFAHIVPGHKHMAAFPLPLITRR